VQLFSGGPIAGTPRTSWDAHESVLENHATEALRVDQPVAALVRDLKQRGLLSDTLVLFTTEFGRTPFAQSAEDAVGTGRDHNRYGFSVWLAGAGLRSGLIGTVRYEIGERVLPATRTTPESLDLQELLAQMASVGCKAAVMEVSSHALAQERTRGLEWDVTVFTNLTQDHLDFHQTMANYFESKARLFTGLRDQPNKKQATAVINLDDPYGERIVSRLDHAVPVVTYGMSARADFRASNYRVEFSGTSFQLDARGKIYLVRLPLIGRFNVSNAMAALAAATSLGVSLREAVLSLAKSPQVPGRLEAVPAKRQFQIFVDYAHTDDALLNVLKTLRELGPRRLILVFGAGGDRDKEKRPLMGRVADQNADYSIITSDNPRKEDPLAIIADVREGFRTKNFETVPDRAEAIARAIALAQPRDIILIAGKGHETYQEFADHTIPFDDRQMARRAIENRPLEF